MGSNRLIYYEETISGEIGQVGTRLDGLGHVGTRVGEEDIFYNGRRASELDAPRGLAKLGIENVGAIFTRGVLLDIAASKNVERPDAGYVITVEDIEGALEQHSLEILEGDVVLFRTGHVKLWMQDNEAYHSGGLAPGSRPFDGFRPSGSSSWARTTGRWRPSPARTTAASLKDTNA